MSNTKTCHRCRRTLPLDAFGMRKDSSDGNEYQCRDCIKKYNADYYRRSKARKQRKRDARPEHGASKVAALSAFFESLDPGKPHTATWWRQAARDGGFSWATYPDVRAALEQAGIEPRDLRRARGQA